MFGWFRRRRRRKLTLQEFPQAWVLALEKNYLHWQCLDSAERCQLQNLVQVFVAEKSWEGCGGLQLTDEIRVTIAASACRMLLGLQEHDYYRNVRSVIVYPSTVVAPSHGSAGGVALHSNRRVPVLGQAVQRGPVVLVWDAVLVGSQHPERGHNVVYHEFAHKLDMLDGLVDGTPRLSNAEKMRRWVEVCTRVYEDLRDRAAKGKGAFLDKYGATNVAEFFAVATEYFFNKPVQMQKRRPELYELLEDFYCQNPREQEERRRDP